MATKRIEHIHLIDLLFKQKDFIHLCPFEIFTVGAISNNSNCQSNRSENCYIVWNEKFYDRVKYLLSIHTNNPVNAMYVWISFHPDVVSNYFCSFLDIFLSLSNGIFALYLQSLFYNCTMLQSIGISFQSTKMSQFWTKLKNFSISFKHSDIYSISYEFDRDLIIRETIPNFLKDQFIKNYVYLFIECYLL